MTEYQACTNNSLLSQWSCKAETRLDMGKESFCFFRSPSGVTWTELKNPRVKLSFFDRSSPEFFDRHPDARLNLTWCENVPCLIQLLEQSCPSSSTYLPQLFQFVDLLSCDLSCSQLLLLRRNLYQPGKETAVLDKRLPLWTVPINIL